MKGLAAALLAAGVLLFSACSSGEASVPSPPIFPRIDLMPLVKGPRSPQGLQAILGTGDLATGANRVAFALTGPKGFVRVPQVSLTSSYRTSHGAPQASGEMQQARFHLWPDGSRGLYVAQLVFPQPGRWELAIQVPQADGSHETVQLAFQVKERPATPPLGAPAPRSVSKTLADVSGLEELTTGSHHDPDLYRIGIRDAVASGLPTVIVLASPAFCVNEVCGPQVEVLSHLKALYGGRAHFIHVDLYDNPHQVQGDLERARFSPAVMEWNLPSIEWTFVVDRQGRIAARFEGFVTLGELREALERVL